VQANAEGSLIVAETKLPAAIWRMGLPLSLMIASALLEWGSPVRAGNPVVGISLMAAFMIFIGWARGTGLSTAERRQAIALFEVMLSILPNARQVSVPEAMSNVNQR
jgi:hypothetical protein